MTDTIERVEDKRSSKDDLASDLDTLRKACDGLNDVGRVEHSRSGEVRNAKSIQH